MACTVGAALVGVACLGFLPQPLLQNSKKIE